MGEYVLPKVKSKYKYTRQNEDELQFDKGAIIQLVSKDEGGWYEGKYNGQIGWFPSNYVREFKPKKITKEAAATTNAAANTAEDKQPPPGTATDEQDRTTTQLKFHDQVIQNFVKTETVHVKEIENLLTIYLNPLKQQSQVLSHPNNYQTLVGNLDEIYEFQNNFLKEIEAASKLSEGQQQIGQLFEMKSENFEKLFTRYCGNHHQAVQVILDNKDALTRYLENKVVGGGESASVGHQWLTSGLSKPFRRLEEYPTILREIERYINETHPDRTLLSKAMSSYEKISFICQELRKRKESEHHMLSSNICGWEGEMMTSLGDVIYSSATICLIGNSEKQSRHLLLFPAFLVMLSTSSRMSAFKYEGKIPVGSIHAKKLEDCPNYQHAFEVKSPMRESLVVVTKSAEEQRIWLQSVEIQCEKYKTLVGVSAASSPTSANHKSSVFTPIPVPPRHASPPNRPITSSTSSSNNFKPRSPPAHKENEGFIEVSVGTNRVEKIWSSWCLRPSMLCRHTPFYNGTRENSTIERSRSPKPKSEKRKKKMSKYELHKKLPQDVEEVVHHPCTEKQNTEQALRAVEEREMLVVIDMYGCQRHRPCGHQRNPHHHHSILEEKLIVEDPDNNDMLIAEKSLIDTVYELKDQVTQLQQEQRKLRKQFEDETRSRLQMEGFIRRLEQQHNS